MTKAQLSADDFEFVAPGAPLEAKDAGPLVLPGEADTQAKDLGPQVLPGEADGKALQPLVLPDDGPGLEPPAPPQADTPAPATPAGPPATLGFLGRWMQSAEARDALAAALDTFDGRDPHGLRWNLRNRDDTVGDDTDELDPLVLPADIGPKDSLDAPVVCNPSDAAPTGPFAFVMDTEGLLSGRDPHRLLLQPTTNDWVW